MELVNVTTAVINGYEQPAVNARELWEKLGSKQEFANWIKNRLADFKEGVDYLLAKIGEQLPSGKKYKIEYTLTLDTAKHLAMLERNENGKKIRQYFIEIERGFYKTMEKELSESLPCPAESSSNNLLESTKELLLAINARLCKGEDIEAHILKYCWNMATMVKQPVVTRAISCDDYINRFVGTIPRGEQLSRSDVYGSYCDFCRAESCTPKSPRSFWPQAAKCAQMRNIRTSNARYIIVEL